jgi:hypothetical protein
LSLVASAHSLCLLVCPESGKRVDSSGSIQSPGFPGHYEGGLFCEWKITANVGYKVHITAGTFNLQDCPRCECDKIAIYDGDSSERRALGNWCTSSPFNVISTGRNLYVIFSSNFDVIGGGFQATYVTIRDEEGLYTHTAICIQAQTANIFSRVFLRLKRGVYRWKLKCIHRSCDVSQ